MLFTTPLQGTVISIAPTVFQPSESAPLPLPIFLMIACWLEVQIGDPTYTANEYKLNWCGHIAVILKQWHHLDRSVINTLYHKGQSRGLSGSSI